LSMHRPNQRPLLENLEPRQLLATFTVTSLADSGPDTLRQAIDDANNLAGADVIEFGGDTIDEVIGLTSGELLITDDLTINGHGSSLLTVNANNNSRVFYIDNEDGPVSISGLTITGGNGIGGGSNQRGGGVYNVGGSLALTDVTVSNNSAWLAGGIYNWTGELTPTAAASSAGRTAF
jgi:hypothetical protein